MKTSNHSMKKFTAMWIALILIAVISLHTRASAQTSIPYAGGSYFLNGTNVPWVSFAGDLGPRSSHSANNVNFSEFQTIFQTMHQNGGNVMRLWLHTNGVQTPAFGSNGYVTGPGPYAIQDLKKILNLAEQNNVGLILCLWSFDMLQAVGSEGLTQTQVNYNYKLLTDTSYTMTYIRNSLIPMVDSVKNNPAIVAWEIFNEPEGMSDEFGGGWGTTQIPMADIQRCVNLMAGAIHRTDPNALVTNGAWAFQSLTDFTPIASARESERKTLQSMNPAQQQAITDEFNKIYRIELTAPQVMQYVDKLAATTNYNYYRDDRLIAIGGDSLGTLDFYCVHYYAWMGITYAPFLVPCSMWGLSKPLVVAEFGFSDILGSGLFGGITSQGIYPDLYSNHYAGAINWAWTTIPDDNTETLHSMQAMSNQYPGNIGIDIIDKALNTSVTVSSNDTLAEPASSPDNLTDGESTTRWQASQDSSQWIMIDLGQPDTIGRIEIDWANKTFARVFSVVVSNDLNNWSSISNTNNGTGGINYVETIKGLHAIGRYIKFTFQSEGNGPYSISEIRVFSGASNASIVQAAPGIPDRFVLDQNFPNPFNPTTIISYNLPSNGFVSLKIFDVLGREVKTLANGNQTAGHHLITLDASRLPSGVYFYTLTTRGISVTRKMMLLK